MEKDLNNFMNNIEIINKDLSVYKDEEKGILFHLNTIQLVAKVERLELSSEEYKIKKFEGSIDDIDYDIIEIDRPTPKYNRTKKDEDKYIIENAKVKVRLVWNVSNALGMRNSFKDKELAIQFANEINNKVLPYFK